MGVVTDYMIMDHRVHTSVVFVSRSEGTPDFEAFRSGDYQLTPEEVDPAAVSSAAIVHASTFALSREPCRSAVEKAFRQAHEQNKIISLDPNYSPQIWPDLPEARDVLRDMLAYASITKPSLDDARRLLGDGMTPEAYIAAYHEMGPSLVVLTMGAQGFVLSEQGKLTHIPARPIEVVDATGAGDAFWAGFLIALLDGQPLGRCGLFAREIVERKLRTIGPLPESIDRHAIYRQLDAQSGVDAARIA